MAEFEVTGISYQIGRGLPREEATAAAHKFITEHLKPGTPLLLVAEPTNLHDENAIAVYADYTRQVGYVKGTSCLEVKPIYQRVSRKELYEVCASIILLERYARTEEGHQNFADIKTYVMKVKTLLSADWSTEAYGMLWDKLLALPSVQDTINAMHRYRDAIYYGSRQNADGQRFPRNKEVIGGYILFPGRVSEADKLEDKYFLRSIKSVNIGAYPLLPKKLEGDADIDNLDLVECGKLEEDLRRIILEATPSQQLQNSIPQKGLFYTEESPKDAIVYVGYVKSSNPFFADFLANQAPMYYTGSEDTRPNLDIQRIRYFMPIIKGKVSGIYKVTAINAARKSDKNANNDNTDDGVRFFLMLDEFISYGEAVLVGQSLHNADWMSVEEAKARYEELKLKEIG